ncbi:MAG: hypothetical protein Q4P84_03720 [Elusimicrobiales bacterium]|nr:hypothetical protein [Elusimicrobiales bacterium]
MEHITGAYAWLKANWPDILALWACVIGTAEIVVKWTDSKKDDEVLGKVRAAGVKVISWLTKFGFEQSKAK